MFKNNLILVIVFWMAVSGLSFTSVCMYDYSSKVMLVEIEEEEDGAEEDSDETVKTEKIAEAVSYSIPINFHSPSFFSDTNPYTLRSGYFLGLIKPPLTLI